MAHKLSTPSCTHGEVRLCYFTLLKHAISKFLLQFQILLYSPGNVTQISTNEDVKRGIFIGVLI